MILYIFIDDIAARHRRADAARSDQRPAPGVRGRRGARVSLSASGASCSAVTRAYGTVSSYVSSSGVEDRAGQRLRVVPGGRVAAPEHVYQR